MLTMNFTIPLLHFKYIDITPQGYKAACEANIWNCGESLCIYNTLWLTGDGIVVIIHEDVLAIWSSDNMHN